MSAAIMDGETQKMSGVIIEEVKSSSSCPNINAIRRSVFRGVVRQICKENGFEAFSTEIPHVVQSIEEK
jgi:hypothetical protein